MSYTKFIYKSLLYYWKGSLGIFLGTVLASAVLTGSLSVGDSVEYSLLRTAQLRLGKISHAAHTGDLLFVPELADRMENEGMEAAAVLHLPGSLSTENGGLLPEVQIYGVEDDFFQFSDGTQPISLAGREAAISARTAAKAGIKKGDTVILKFSSISEIPAETPAARNEQVRTMAVSITELLEDSRMGRFSLRAHQEAPDLIYLSRNTFSHAVDAEGKCNLLLIGRPDLRDSGQVNSILRKVWNPEDSGIVIDRPGGRNICEIRTTRIFFTNATAEKLMSMRPSAIGVFAYFVNELKTDEASCPYSFVVGLPVGRLKDRDLSEGGMIVSKWLAEDLGLSPGDDLSVKYFLPGPTGRVLEEKETSFRVEAVFPTGDGLFDESYMPPFPGLAEAETCSDWEPGFFIDTSRIREKDEAYWERYKGKPKAVISLKDARKIWSGRFGEMTAVRYNIAGPEDFQRIKSELDLALSPEQFGLLARNVRKDAFRAGREGVDFGQLFIGLSFFIIASAVMLVGLLFGFNAESRSGESGLLRALGFGKNEIFRLFICEQLLIVSAGTLVGVPLGLLYTKGVLWGLSRVWQGAVGSVELLFSADPLNVLISIFATTAAAMSVIAFVARSNAARTVVELQSGPSSDPSSAASRSLRPWILSGITFIAAAALFVFSLVGADKKMAAGIFFAVGTLLLVSFLAFVAGMLKCIAGNFAAATVSRIWKLGIRGAVRRPGRSISVVSLLASGVFVVVAVAANYQKSISEWREKKSPTGGYMLYAESAVPLLHPFKSEETRRQFGLEKDFLDTLSLVSCRVRVGEDASCLNLNRVSHPRIIALKPVELKGRFSFASMLEDSPEDPWKVLDTRSEDGAIPVFVDQGVMLWGLGKSLGDKISYVDENGNRFDVRLAGALKDSIFQGSILMGEENFLEKYPSSAGKSVFLIGSERGDVSRVETLLETAMADIGFRAEFTKEKLQRLLVVYNTYLQIFLALGGLGVVLGSVGLGIVLLKNVLERRSELALLRALGYSRNEVSSLMRWEHGFLLFAGILAGLFSALIAVWPVISGSGEKAPAIPIIIFLSALLLNGFAWILISARVVLSGDLVPALRRE